MAQTVEVKGSTIIITLDLHEGQVSASGKTMLVAGMNGPSNATDPKSKRPLKVNCNVFYKP